MPIYRCRGELDCCHRTMRSFRYIFVMTGNFLKLSIEGNIDGRIHERQVVLNFSGVEKTPSPVIYIYMFERYRNRVVRRKCIFCMIAYYCCQLTGHEFQIGTRCHKEALLRRSLNNPLFER